MPYNAFVPFPAIFVKIGRVVVQAAVVVGTGVIDGIGYILRIR